MSKRPYTKESIWRALQHHEMTGVVTSFSPPYVGQPKWFVRVLGSSDRLELNMPEAHALCVGLAAAERKYTREENPS